MKRAVRGFLAFCGVVCTSMSAASALNSGFIYVCSTRIVQDTTSTYGSQGYVVFDGYTAPSCGGSIITADRRLCSTGATAADCPGKPMYHYNEAQLLAQFAALRDSMLTGHRVYMSITTCNSGSVSCPSTLSFNAN